MKKSQMLSGQNRERIEALEMLVDDQNTITNIRFEVLLKMLKVEREVFNELCIEMLRKILRDEKV